MKTIWKKNNTACLFHDVNQWDEKLTKMMCTIYFGFINAKYNWVIKDFTEKEIKAVAEEQYEKGRFSYERWGRLNDGINAVFDYLNSKWYTCNLTSLKNDREAKEWLERWYAVWLWISVDSKKFYQDKKDWKLDLLDYKWYKGNVWHATNLIKWTERGKIKNWEEFFLDSYFWKSSIYKCDIDEVFEDIDMSTKRILH